MPVSFGLLPYASHSWFFALPFYVGLEDDHDVGALATWRPGRFTFHLGLFKNAEPGLIGELRSSARLGYDVVPARVGELERFEEETNAVHGRAALRLGDETFGAEVGLSARWGQLWDGTAFGDHQAAAVHVEARLHRFDFKLEAARYRYAPADGSDTVVFGAFGIPYAVAAEGSLFVAGLAYELPVELGPVERLLLYEDASFLVKHVPGASDSALNSLGVRVDAGPVLSWIEWIAGRNMPFVGPETAFGLAAGRSGAPWEHRLNVNFGYYFF